MAVCLKTEDGVNILCGPTTRLQGTLASHEDLPPSIEWIIANFGGPAQFLRSYLKDLAMLYACDFFA